MIRQRKMSSLMIHVIKIGVVGGCLLGLLSGCSSQLRTTIVSGTEAQEVKVAQLEPEAVAVEEVAILPIQEEIRMDIPVEAPARSVPRHQVPAEIFSTPKSTDAASAISPFSEDLAPVPADEPIATFMPSVEPPVTGIPSKSLTPEMPALPLESYDKGALTPQAEIPPTPELRPEQEPIQVAKAMPQELEQVEIIEETLEKALSDIYFDYDQFSIRDDAGTLLTANAQLLSEKFADAQIVVEGHCDERGTRSYNMVLGERRAKAVKHYLQDLGVPAENLQVVSYGKEKPFCMEPTEACWQENRRGHFVIK